MNANVCAPLDDNRFAKCRPSEPSPRLSCRTRRPSSSESRCPKTRRPQQTATAQENSTASSKKRKKKTNPQKARHGRAGKRGGVEKTQIERAAECVIKLGREDGGAQRMVLICRTALDPGGPLYRVYGRCPRTICSPFAGGGLQKEEI